MPRRNKFGQNVDPIKMPEVAPLKEPEIPLDDVAMVTIDGKRLKLSLDELDEEDELGSGAYGSVTKMRHRETGIAMAVKRIKITLDQRQNSRAVMDYNVAMKSLDCPFTITYYGALFREGNVWICIELMDRSLDKLCRCVYSRLNERIPETIVGSMAYATLEALHYLKSKLNIMHRDVKPSNILINRNGEIKMCDFGISGELVNSCAGTNIGCPPYLAPERIEDCKKPYDHRSDVWSYGITLYELAVGRFPYRQTMNEYEQVQVVVHGPAPRIPEDMGFSEIFKDYVHRCLAKDKDQRARYVDLLSHDFFRSIKHDPKEVASWFSDVLARESALPPLSDVATREL